MADAIDQMCELFRGRLDAYGTDEGGCDKVDTSKWGIGQEVGPMAEYRRRMTNHLVGSAPFGVYPLVYRDNEEDWPHAHIFHVRWGCTDLDNVTSPAVAKNIANLLGHWGIQAWVELSRSKGFHVWAFSYDWVPADVMRRAFLAAHQVLGVPAREVNPKQTSLAEGQFGNYVRIPYPGALTEQPVRQVVYDCKNSTPISLAQFAYEAYSYRNRPDTFRLAASRYKPPPPKATVEITGVGPIIDHVLARRLNKPGYLAFKYGPQEGHDRSDSLARLAHNCRESGLNPSEAYSIVWDADGRWGKFHDRNDGEDQVRRLIENAYG